jgi:hypothetical protein
MPRPTRRSPDRVSLLQGPRTQAAHRAAKRKWQHMHNHSSNTNMHCTAEAGP